MTAGRVCLALCVAISVPGCAPARATIDPTVQHGYALAYVQGRFGETYRLEATITMPARPENKDWTANYIMVAAKRKKTLDQPMYQVGLIRLGPSPRTLRTFWATGPQGKRLDYREAGVVTDGPHRFALAAHDRTLSIEVDGRVVRSLAWDEIFARGDNLYVQLGSEAVVPGDAVSGTYRDIFMTYGNARPQHVLPACRYNDRGLAIRRDVEAQQLEAFGVYTVSMPSFYVDCH
jgi:hypothetical protein